VLKSEQADDLGLLGHDAIWLGEYEGTTFLLNAGNHSYHDTTSHARRHELSNTAVGTFNLAVGTKQSPLSTEQNSQPSPSVRCHTAW